MTHHIDPLGSADIRIGELVWPKSFEGTRSEQQQGELMRLVDEAGTGLIVDCTFVEVGNSEIISLLMRVRNHAKKRNKEIALFSVPATLDDVIKLCNLKSVLPAAEDATAAKKLVFDQSRGRSPLHAWLESNLAILIVFALFAFIIIGLTFWLVL